MYSGTVFLKGSFFKFLTKLNFKLMFPIHFTFPIHLIFQIEKKTNLKNVLKHEFL